MGRSELPQRYEDIESIGSLTHLTHGITNSQMIHSHADSPPPVVQDLVRASMLAHAAVHTCSLCLDDWLVGPRHARLVSHPTFPAIARS
ncbi:hypothetical protein OBBRIDRAFT_41495 [Obba rivulosa]|uniref:Uncharacterized protein n=1 Tax=Obba rivulosa TaxID=1052685 RepID=A0A8E2AVU5_9APHY|nr:hypothetical protein OBBRIDRAFT_41495 [Obba rivulosa]